MRSHEFHLHGSNIYCKVTLLTEKGKGTRFKCLLWKFVVRLEEVPAQHFLMANHPPLHIAHHYMIETIVVDFVRLKCLNYYLQFQWPALKIRLSRW